jgi:hypothetical protein
LWLTRRAFGLGVEQALEAAFRARAVSSGCRRARRRRLAGTGGFAGVGGWVGTAYGFADAGNSGVDRPGSEIDYVQWTWLVLKNQPIVGREL